jgi:hypothetical protein
MEFDEPVSQFRKTGSFIANFPTIFAGITGSWA